MTPEQRAWIEARHYPIVIQDEFTVCGRDEDVWPCDAYQILAALAEAEVELAGMKRQYGIQAQARLKAEQTLADMLTEAGRERDGYHALLTTERERAELAEQRAEAAEERYERLIEATASAARRPRP